MWIARDKYGGLWLHSGKPVKYMGGWILNKGDAQKYFFDDGEPTYYIRLDPSTFPEVTFENSPKELVIK